MWNWKQDGYDRITYLDDDKHVIDADTEHQKRDNGVNGSVNDAHIKTETVRGQNGLTDHRNAHDGQDQLRNWIIERQLISLVTVNNDDQILPFVRSNWNGP